jgi:hypothetical protein
MGSPTRYACYGKEMLGWIREKMVIQKSTLGGGRFFASGPTAIGDGASAYNGLYIAGGGACNGPCVASSSTRSIIVPNVHYWAPTPSRFSPHNVECRKGEG